MDKLTELINDWHLVNDQIKLTEKEKLRLLTNPTQEELVEMIKYPKLSGLELFVAKRARRFIKALGPINIIDDRLDNLYEEIDWVEIELQKFVKYYEIPYKTLFKKNKIKLYTEYSIESLRDDDLFLESIKHSN